MSDTNLPSHSCQKTKATLRLKPGSASGDDDDESSQDPGSDSDTLLPSSVVQREVSRSSGGAETSLLLFPV